MKFNKIVVILLVGGIVLTMAYFLNKKRNIDDGRHGTGYYEDYNFKKKPKVIKSTDIISFKIDFEDGNTVDDSKLPYGRYYISLEKTDDIGKLSFTFRGYGEVILIEKDLPLEVFINLQKIIEDENVEEINGYCFNNTALGYFLDLEILYESGEKITAYAEGGSVNPQGFNGKALVEFFYNMVEEELEKE
ncbi:MAG: hypothetical protein GX368_04785 [Erysipelotrichaceae bacterium]|nr:hypothetical protein [Erysipelotrichaceae bacterium]